MTELLLNKVPLMGDPILMPSFPFKIIRRIFFENCWYVIVNKMQTAPDNPTSEIRFFFDFLKSVSIVGIFFFHLFDNYLQTLGTTTSEIINSGILKYFLLNTKGLIDYIYLIFGTIFSFGSIGVELFVIASGFGLYLSHLSKKNTWGAFYKKRFLRVIPLYYLFLLISFLTYAYIFNDDDYSSPEGLKSLAYTIFLLQTANKSYHLYALYYFVSIIFQLYLAFPLLKIIISLRRWQFQFFIFTCLLSSLLYWIFKLLHINFTGMLFTDFLPYFFLGMLVADSVFHKRKLHTIIFDSRLSLLSMIILVTSVYMTSYIFDYNEGFKIMIRLSVFLIIPFLFTIINKLKSKTLIRLTSYSSYAFYLTHILFLRIISQLLITKFDKLHSLFYFHAIVSFPLVMLLAYFIQKNYDMLLTFVLSGVHRGQPLTRT